MKTPCRSRTPDEKEAENEMVEHLNTYSMDFFAVRTAFLDHFADKTKSYYQSISRLYPHPDGVYSNGYMWEVLTPAYVIHYAKALELLASHERILVLADSLKPSAAYPRRAPVVSVTSGAKLCEALDYGKIPTRMGICMCLMIHMHGTWESPRNLSGVYIGERLVKQRIFCA